MIMFKFKKEFAKAVEVIRSMDSLDQHAATLKYIHLFCNKHHRSETLTGLRDWYFTRNKLFGYLAQRVKLLSGPGIDPNTGELL